MKRSNCLNSFFLSAFCLFALSLNSCSKFPENKAQPQSAKPEAQPEIKIAEKFSFPLAGGKMQSEAKDSDEWYNARDFGEENHLGEDWNKNTGGNTDCGEVVLAAADGLVTFAGDAGPGWGNVLIIEHRLKNGKRIESLYGHLNKIEKTGGEVKRREKIGEIGNANGKYPCHLHFEIREESCRDWGRAGGGYSEDREGWLDPSGFIEKNK